MKQLIKDKERRKIRFFTIEELSNLNTKRLLTFYKKERARYFRLVAGMTCECCGEPMSEIYPDDGFRKEVEVIETQWNKYLKQIKEELNKREHVEAN